MAVDVSVALAWFLAGSCSIFSKRFADGSGQTHVHNSRPPGASARNASASAAVRPGGLNSSFPVPPGGIAGDGITPSRMTVNPELVVFNGANRRSCQVNLQSLA